MRWDELVLLMEGISPKVARRHRYVIEEKTASEEENNRNHPKQADFYMTFLLVNFAVKKRHV